MATLLKLGRKGEGWVSLEPMNHSGLAQHPQGETSKLPWKEPLLFPEWPVANTSKEACNLAPGLTSKVWRNLSNWGVGVIIWTLGLCHQHEIKMLGLCRENSWGHIWHAEPYERETDFLEFGGCSSEALASDSSFICLPKAWSRPRSNLQALSLPLELGSGPASLPELTSKMFIHIYPGTSCETQLDNVTL